MKVHVENWSAVGYWVWDVKDEDDICGICQNAFDGVCGTCEEPGDQCPLRECENYYHLRARNASYHSHLSPGSVWYMLTHFPHALHYSMD